MGRVCVRVGGQMEDRVGNEEMDVGVSAVVDGQVEGRGLGGRRGL